MIIDVSKYGREIIKEPLSAFLCLGILRIGNEIGCYRYQKAIEKQAKHQGISIKLFEKELAAEEEILAQIDRWNQDEAIHGILLLHPIPKKFNERFLKERIAREKDIDGLAHDLFLPATVEAILFVMKKFEMRNHHKKIAIIGRSEILGTPLFKALRKEEQVTLFYQGNLPSDLREYDCVINATGKSNLTEDGKIRDDCFLFSLNTGQYFSSFKGRQVTTASGLGYLTTLFLFKHLQDAKNASHPIDFCID